MLRVIRRKWRAILWAMLLLVVTINALIFLGMPGSRVGGRTGQHQPQDGVLSHLQVIRKRLNKSVNNSSSLHQGERRNAFLKSLDDEEGGEDGTDTADNGDERNVAGLKMPPNPHLLTSMAYKTEIVTSLGDSRKSREGGFGAAGGRANYSLAEVDQFTAIFVAKYQATMFNIGNLTVSYNQLLQRLNSKKKRGTKLNAYINNKGPRSWERFHYGIRQHYLYNPSDSNLDRLLRDMTSKPVIDVEQKEGGTQIKLIISMEDDGQALFKPMRFGREQETLPDHFYFADYERHTAEIAAFHLDRVLGFHRVPPTVGRLMNMTRDIHRLANSRLAKTFFISPAGNVCFHGSCSYYCDSSHPICGHPTMLEGSMAAFLPPFSIAKRKTWRNPWKRSYSKHRKAYWEVYNDLCKKVKSKHPYNEGRRLLDVLDMSVFDFLTGNMDRHHYETFKDFGNDTFLLHLDNGRAFGKASYDCISCLAPVRQCCMIRLSTLAKLVKLYQGPESLSYIMRQSLTLDPLNPILVDRHLDALDRRLSKILHVIHSCIQDGKSWHEVIVDDGIT